MSQSTYYLLQGDPSALGRVPVRPGRDQDERLPHHGHQAPVLGGALRQSHHAGESHNKYLVQKSTYLVLVVVRFVSKE